MTPRGRNRARRARDPGAKRPSAIVLRALILICMTLSAPGADAAPDAQDLDIVMGVTDDAPPFAWRDPNSGIFRGFLYDLCVAAVARTSFSNSKKVAILPIDREKFFKGDNPQKIDLLCDPTTINLKRFRDLAEHGLEFSPIVFVANGSYVINPKNSADKAVIKDAARCRPFSDMAAAPAPAETAAADEAKPERLAAGFVRGTTNEETLRSTIRRGALVLKDKQVVCPVEYQSHWTAARAFCEGKLRYFFGDDDILRGMLAVQKKSFEGCDVTEEGPNPLSYEPYAFVVSDLHPEFRLEFKRALYEVFYSGKAKFIFAEHFGNRSMSPFLETLFRINSIPSGKAQDAPTQGATAAPR